MDFVQRTVEPARMNVEKERRADRLAEIAL